MASLICNGIIQVLITCAVALIAGIAGLFTIFSSFVFSIAVINLVGSDLSGLK